MEQPYHIPALLKESIEGLVTNPDGVYVDATMGGAGHTRAILKALSPKGRLLGFDQDLDAIANAPEDERFTFVRSNFRYMRNFLRFHGIDKVDGILADIGVSFHHFDDSERGFSFREEAPLDMRMNRKATMTAADWLADSNEETIARQLKLYTDLKRTKEIARAIVESRQKTPLQTTADLQQSVQRVLNPKNMKKDLAQVFQAIRIAVNAELDVLAELLISSTQLLRPGGRIAILSYHSVEDRMVKNYFKTGYLDESEIPDRFRYLGQAPTPWKVITRSPLTPSQEEIEANPRSRSAKLRIAERNDTPWPPKD